LNALDPVFRSFVDRRDPSTPNVSPLSAVVGDEIRGRVTERSIRSGRRMDERSYLPVRRKRPVDTAAVIGNRTPPVVSVVA